MGPECEWWRWWAVVGFGVFLKVEPTLDLLMDWIWNVINSQWSSMFLSWEHLDCGSVSWNREDWGGQLKSGRRGGETKNCILAVFTLRLLATHGGSVRLDGGIARLKANKLEEIDHFAFFCGFISWTGDKSHSWRMKLLDYFRVIGNLLPLLLTLGRASWKALLFALRYGVVVESRGFWTSEV